MYEVVIYCSLKKLNNSYICVGTSIAIIVLWPDIFNNLPINIMFKSKSDYQLQEEIFKNRNESAFEALYSRYWEKIFVICQNRLKDEDISSGLVQDIFISIWQHKNLLDVHNLEAYLFRATKFSIIKFLNRASRVDRIDPQESGYFDMVDDMDISDALHVKEIQSIIFQEVEKLPTQTKLIFKYSRIDNLNSKEIAEKLDISPRTVENQISKALKVLRNVLKNTRIIIFFTF